MNRSADLSRQWILLLTAGLLFASALLRTLLLYGGDPAIPPVLVLLSTWLLLFVGETILSYKWPGAPSWHFPVYLGLQVLIVLALMFLLDYGDYFSLLFCILSFQVMQRMSQRTGGACIALFAPLIFFPLVRSYGTVGSIAFALVVEGANIVMAFYALAARRSLAAREQNRVLAEELRGANRQAESYARQLEQVAVARERQCLARELHDSVTQTIFSMTLTTQSATLMLERDPGRLGAQLARLNDLAQNALSELRGLIAELGPEKVSEATLSARLQGHLAVRQLPETLSITVEAEGAQVLSSSEDQSLFRIIQEALNNIVKHAGATQACVLLHLRDPLWIEIRDNGRGFDLVRAHDGSRLGLNSMRERAAEIGWVFRLESSPGSGTRIRVEKPPGERRV